MVHAEDSILGRVVALWRYPVKSMQGEALNRALLDERGILGDRALALLDVETGKVASAKSPRMWPNLLDFHATFGAIDVEFDSGLGDGSGLRRR